MREEMKAMPLTLDEFAELCVDTVIKKIRARNTRRDADNNEYIESEWKWKAFDERILACFNKGDSIRSISKEFGIPYGTLDKFLKGKPRDVEGSKVRGDYKRASAIRKSINFKR